MRTTISVDDGLYAKAQAFSNAQDNASVVREALETYVRVQAAKRLAVLGGAMPDMPAVPRVRTRQQAQGLPARRGRASA